ncbi:MAG: DUF1501 domain-containing protein [Gemmataceae bacterium]|nr:DUF1501 domain-containing protein [Gemmataceae bacterium]
MLTILGSPRKSCDGITRRETLRAGALSGLGLLGAGWPAAAQALSPDSSRPGKAKSVIMLYLLGGAPTQDMWDLKPNAPAEVRGEFKPVPTSAPGIFIGEHLPLLARWMHKAAIVRSVNHKGGCHNPLPSYTGYETLPSDIVSTKDTFPPSMGSVCEYLGQGNTRALPNYVYLPTYLGWGQSIRRPGPYAGFLGKRCDPLFTECNPTVDNPTLEKPGFNQPVRGVPLIADSVLAGNITLDRLDQRKSMLFQLDEQRRAMMESGAAGKFTRVQDKAFSILTSEKVRAAFNPATEEQKLQDRYSRTLFGQSALVARKLVESGVRFVNVTWDCYWEKCKINHDCWDTHTRNFTIMKEYNLPYFDQTCSALLGDLEDRGLLDETLVVVTSEMGRTPKINGNAGRDHWTYCYSTVLFGAGIRGGTVYGASDSQAAYVKDLPASPADICATIYQCLGIDPGSHVPDQTGKPISITQGGNPIREILA